MRLGTHHVCTRMSPIPGAEITSASDERGTRVFQVRGVELMNNTQENPEMRQPIEQHEIRGLEVPVDVRTAAHFLGVSPSLMYAFGAQQE